MTNMNRAQTRVVDPILTEVALGYSDPSFVGMELFPEVNSPKSGARIIRFGKEAFLKYNLRRAPGAKVARVQFGHDSDPIALVQDSVEGVVPREHMDDTDDLPNIDLASSAVEGAMDITKRALEIEQAELAQDANNYPATNKITLATAWTDPSADLKATIDAGKAAVRKKIGSKPNVLVIPYDAFQGASNNTAAKEQFKYTSSESLTEAMLARYLGVAKVVVAEGTYAPDEDSDFLDIWSKGVLAYVPQNGRNIRVPSYGYTYKKAKGLFAEEAYWDHTVKSYVYPVEYERRPYITALDAGYLIDGIQ